MKEITYRVPYFHFNVMLLHILIGILIAIFVLHPITMVVYWFEFNPSDISFDLFADVFVARIKHSFHSSMLPMSIIFAVMGGFFGFVSGLYSRTLKIKRTLHEKNDQLIELDNIKSNFLRLISHEIRTPLHGIVGFVSLLKNMDTTSELRRIVDMLEASVTRLENFSLTALKITELRTNAKKIKNDKINLLEEVRWLLSKHSEKIDQKQVTVTISSGLNDGQTFAYADAALFSTCIDLILSNALQFCKKNISIDGWEDTSISSAILEIRDDGNWFSAQEEKNVFELLGSGTTHLVGFNGLDFPLIKLICEAQKGKVEIGTTTDGGDTVKLYFPYYKN
ncbi:MAG: HAMP domain-containing sensor histidine kinase [Prolixibacteraceae bacterium]|nr:HAMP domain-containing sensor histidine kinase [Prolixibacteraceae bacterium]